MYGNEFAAASLTVGSIVPLPSVRALAQPALTPGAQADPMVFVCEHGTVIAAAHLDDPANKTGLPYRLIACGVHSAERATLLLRDSAGKQTVQ